MLAARNPSRQVNLSRFVRLSRTKAIRPRSPDRVPTGDRMSEQTPKAGRATASSPTIDVVIPNWNGAETLPRVLKAIENQTLRPRRVIVVDDACEDDTELLRRTTSLALTVLRNTHNRGFAATANRGFAASDAPYRALLNNDAYPSEDWLACAYSHFADPGVATVATLMVSDTDPTVVDNAGLGFTSKKGIFPRAGGSRRDSPELQMCHEVFAATGGAAVFRVDILPRVPPFDESLVAYNEDADFAWALYGAGLKAVCCVEAEILHEGGRSYGHWSSRHAYLHATNEIKVLIGNVPLTSHPIHAMRLLVHLARLTASLALTHGHARAVGSAIREAARTWPHWRAARSATRKSLRHRSLEGLD